MKKEEREFEKRVLLYDPEGAKDRVHPKQIDFENGYAQMEVDGTFPGSFSMRLVNYSKIVEKDYKTGPVKVCEGINEIVQIEFGSMERFKLFINTATRIYNDIVTKESDPYIKYRLPTKEEKAEYDNIIKRESK